MASFPTFGIPNATAGYIVNSSGNKANANAVATIAHEAGKLAWISGFSLAASGATAGLPVNATVAGVLGGTMTFTFTYPAGVLVAAQPLNITFPFPLPAVDASTDIVVTLPASGSGGTNAAAVAYGFVQ